MADIGHQIALASYYYATLHRDQRRRYAGREIIAHVRAPALAIRPSITGSGPARAAARLNGYADGTAKTAAVKVR